MLPPAVCPTYESVLCYFVFLIELKITRKQAIEKGMELSGQEGEIPIPINSSGTYGGGHGNGHGHGHGVMIHHDPLPQHNNHMIVPPSNGTATMQQHEGFKKVVRYRECLKNHAAAMGGNATDGCGEFMASGEEGTIEALSCSACHCHRNFHRKEVEGEPSSCDYIHTQRRKFLHKNILPPEALGYPTPPGNILPSRTVPPHQIIMPYSIGPLPSESDDQEDVRPTHTHHHNHLVKKRFRTKFTQEQKDKMFNFAEKVGWKIQKQEDSVVQQFCQEIGVKRRVLKVWMHNNKHNLAKKNPPTAP
ncbi:hypothetical protein VNO77_06077 [Canavalia gladiata]|uniref:ZF-HD dimerization-type domain-containing protein n=1 Tax=Canavalia gladiata TaxID=3824 RepID=A0AAN9MZG1_CANGL